MNEKCKDCMHQLKGRYCKGYQVSFELIDVSKCTRKKVAKKK